MFKHTNCGKGGDTEMSGDDVSAGLSKKTSDRNKNCAVGENVAPPCKKPSSATTLISSAATPPSTEECTRSLKLVSENV